MFKEFKAFIMRGNILDLAIGVIIGGAFGKIVTSFVNDILMPPIGLLMGEVDFGNMFIDFSGGDFATLAAAQEAGAVTMNIGLFLNTVIDFIIVALVIFLVLKQVNKLKKEKEEVPAPVTTKTCPYCQSTVPLAATKCAFCTSDLPETK